MMYRTKQRDDERTVTTVLKEDLRRGDFGLTVRRDWNELKYFVFEGQREKLSKMSMFKRVFYIPWWFFRTLLLNLTPARRLLFVIGAFFAITNITVENFHFSLGFPGGLLILFVLILELKDKLLASRELEAGHAVQLSLMPKRSPTVPGWQLWLYTRSANEVGGDLIDFIRSTDRKYGIVVADVAGKGLSSALIAAKLQAIVKALAPDFSSLAELGTKLNLILRRDCPSNIFASLVYIEIEPDSALVRVLNAGQIPPVIVMNSYAQKMKKGDVALGLSPTALFTEQAVQVDHGEVILACSDGLTEALNNEGELFGEHRLLTLLPQLKWLPLEQIGEQLIAEVDRFVGGSAVRDDISIALLKRM